jgi:hypothetical protein
MEHQIRPKMAVCEKPVGGPVGRVAGVEGDRVRVIFSGGKSKVFNAADLIEVKLPRRPRAIPVRF